MSTSNSPASAMPNGADPSMEDILASIRRILSDDEVAAANAGAGPATGPASRAEDDNVFVLDNSMMIGAPSAPPEPPPITHPEPPPAHDAHLLGAESEAAAAASVGTLLRTLTAERTTEIHRGGPTIEDLVREGIRPLLKSWLDVHLPPLVERTVRQEIERIVGRASL
jgi:cell pole-organizing protein PopZ